VNTPWHPYWAGVIGSFSFAAVALVLSFRHELIDALRRRLQAAHRSRQFRAKLEIVRRHRQEEAARCDPYAEARARMIAWLGPRYLLWRPINRRES